MRTSSQADQADGDSEIRPGWAGRILFGVLLGTLVWSGRAFLDYGSLAARLAGGSLEERGALGCDESRNFLARSGRPASAHPSTAMADVWRWLVRMRPRLGDGARVRVRIGSPLVYYYATTLWYPHEVDVSSDPGALITDAESLRQQIEPPDATALPDLRRQGYSHVAEWTRRGPTLLDLAAVKP